MKRLFVVFIFLISACVHHSSLVMDRQCAAISCAAATSGELTINDAKKLVDNNRWQEGAWLLRQIGDHKMAEALEDQIVVNYERMKIKSIEKMDTRTVSEVYLVTLENGQKGIFKPHARHWTEKPRIHQVLANPESEVMVYLFARELQLALVPVTVKRTIDGMEGSLQAFIQNTDLDYTWTEMQQSDLRSKVFEYVYNPLEFDKIILDFLDNLAYNTDREGNQGLRWVMSPKLDPRAKPGQGVGAVAYDNGAAFQDQNSAAGRFKPYRPQSTIVTQRAYINPQQLHRYQFFFKALENRLTKKRIHELMKVVYSKKVIEQTINRRQILLDFYKELLK